MVGKPKIELPENLPNLPIGWQWYALGDLVSDDRGISYGVVQPGQEHPEGVPIVRVNNIKQGQLILDDVKRISPEIEAPYSRTRLRGGEILLTLVGTLGECVVVPDDLIGWNLARAVGVIPLRPSIDARWVTYCLRSALVKHYVQAWANTTVQATLNLGDVQRIPIPMPEPDEIARLVGLLRSLDDKIELNRRMNATLEATARALFQSWFVDFDPVHAKARGEQPAGVDAATAALFPDSFEESALGPIPSGWRVGTLGDVCSYVMSGGTPTTTVEAYWNGGIPWLSSGETRSPIIVGTEKTITELGANESSTRFAPKWSTVIASAGQGHTRGQTSLLMIDTYINQSVVALGASCPPISNLYLYFNLSRRYEELRRVSDSSSSRGSLTTTILREMSLVVPASKLVDTFETLVAPLVCQIAHLERQSRTLAETRDALLPKLVSGEVRVPGPANGNR